MSNIPDNELNGQVTPSATEGTPPETENDGVFSTVFSDPGKKNDSKPNKSNKKKKIITVIATVLVPLVLLGSMFAVIKLVPKLKEDEGKPNTVSDIEVVNIDTDKLKTVTITNKNGVFKFYSEKTEQPVSSSSGSETETVTKWYQEGLDACYTSSDVIGSAVSTLANVNATREITGKTEEECGLNEPQGSVEYLTEDDTVISYKVGSESPDKTGYYIKVNETGKMYVVQTSVGTLIDFTQLDVASISTMAGLSTEGLPNVYLNDEGKLGKFDSLKISGVNLDGEMTFAPNTNENSANFTPYIETAPIRRLADGLDEVVNIFKVGVLPDGAYSFDVSAAALASVGLNNPDFTATMTAGDKTHTYIFKKQDDENCAVYCTGWKLIQRVPLASVKFIENKNSAYYTKWVALTYIDDITGLTITTPEKTYDFGITAADEDDEVNYNVTYNGTKVDTKDFQDFYEDCISLTSADYIVDNEAESQPTYTITYHYNDEIGGDEVVEYYKDGASRYQFRINGYKLGRVNSSSMKKLLKSLNEFVESQTK